MQRFIHPCIMIYLVSILSACNGQVKTNTSAIKQSNQEKIVGGGCEGCELMYIDMPAEIGSVDTSSGWTEPGQKLLITGTVYKLDGKTAAPGVIIYYWQTDHKGYYSPKAGMNEKAKRHGHIRGWVKSDEKGKYAIYTIRPAPYPNENIAAHIHTSIKEPGIDNEYYIDEFVFDDDPLLTGDKRKALEQRGGSGVLRLLSSGEMKIAEHHIILGLNIPGYPEKINAAQQSGLQIGEDNPSFIPYHAFGPDKGSRACPVCKYGRYHGIVYFVGNHPDWVEIKKWLVYLDQESSTRKKYLKAYFVYGNEKGYSRDARQKELEQIGKELTLKNIALTYVPSMDDKESDVYLNKIDPEVVNTFVIYKNRTIVEKFIDLKATAENFTLLSSTLDKTKGEYFELPEPEH